MKNVNKISEFPYVFNPCSVVVPPLFVNREKELKRIEKGLLHERNNVIISGPRGIGKSSLIETFFHKISKEKKHKILYYRYTMSPYSEGIWDEFLRYIVQGLCSKIWTELMGKRYSLLVKETLQDPNLKNIHNKHEKILKRIYSIVTSEILSGVGALSKKLGAKIGIETGVQESQQISTKRSPLQSFEFLYFIDELWEILKKYELESIVISLDEFNYIPEWVNKDFFHQFFELLNSKKIQFVLVGVRFLPQEFHVAPQFFRHHIELGPFEDSNHVKSILNVGVRQLKKKYDLEFQFEDSCEKRIFEITEGQPFYIQRLCQDAIYKALKKNLYNITLSLIDECGIEIIKTNKRYNGLKKKNIW